MDPDGRELVTQMIDRGAEGCRKYSCAGWAALQVVYQVGTMGFAYVHDPVREAYDRGAENIPLKALVVVSRLPVHRRQRAE